MKSFGDEKHIKTQIAPKKEACAVYVLKLNNMFSIYFSLAYLARWKGFVCLSFQNISQLCIKEQN